ncbi:MAG: BON domain-containing protein [Acidobacteria bacterium]|nr:BON domain-containing protein [Acidobacteriota bacterium]
MDCLRAEHNISRNIQGRISKDGIVTLSGNVSSKSERSLAERIAREVNGVKSVHNQLDISLLNQGTD